MRLIRYIIVKKKKRQIVISKFKNFITQKKNYADRKSFLFPIVIHGFIPCVEIIIAEYFKILTIDIKRARNQFTKVYKYTLL